MNACLVCNYPSIYIYCSLSCSNKDRRRKNEIKYYLQPKKCNNCQHPISYGKHKSTKFCSLSCAAIFNNTYYPKRISNPKEITTNQTAGEKLLIRFNIGDIRNRNTLRSILIKLHGSICYLCKMQNIWQNKSLTLVIDHIDGNACNNLPNNLRLLCPNCNSQTATFSGRNRGHGRKSRGLQYWS